jgi:hypothetical protein
MSKSGGAGESRTPDLRFRKPPLYPTELQPHIVSRILTRDVNFVATLMMQPRRDLSR